MFVWVKRFFRALGRRELNTAVNVDRVISSQVLGTPVDETISGWSGEHEKTNPIADILADGLDATHFAGDPHHAEDAAKEDEVLIKARQEYQATRRKQ